MTLGGIQEMSKINRQEILDVLDGYDKEDITIATLGSHSSLHMFQGAQAEGFRTAVVCEKGREVPYKNFGVCDELIMVDHFSDIVNDDVQQQLRDLNSIVFPHGSFVAYAGLDNIETIFNVPMFGNRDILRWEAERDLERKLMTESGVRIPQKITDPASFGGILLTFLAGTEIDTDLMRDKFKESFLIGFFSFLVPFLGVFCYTYYLVHWNLQASLISGVALSTTSLAVVYSVLVETNLSKTEIGKLLMASTFITDMGTAIALSILFITPTPYTAYATVLNLFLTSCVLSVSLKCFDIKSPSKNAGNTACPSPRFAKYMKTSNNTNTYLISLSTTLFFNLGFSSTICENLAAKSITTTETTINAAV